MNYCSLYIFSLLQEYQFVVTARDGAPDSRLATASVSVSVVDIEDESPIFHRTTYEASVPENVPDFMVCQVMVRKIYIYKYTVAEIHSLGLEFIAQVALHC